MLKYITKSMAREINSGNYLGNAGLNNFSTSLRAFLTASIENPVKVPAFTKYHDFKHVTVIEFIEEQFLGKLAKPAYATRSKNFGMKT